ncbi:MAG: hypothetical protein AAGF24_05415, partial [Cyanobacteria bacterium P01_H01_bin.121]
EVAKQRYGSRIHCVMLARPWYAEWFPKYLAGMQDGRVLLPPSTDWKDDHRLVELTKGIPLIPDHEIKGSDGKQRHGDAAAAGVLAWFASQQETVSVEYGLPERSVERRELGGFGAVSNFGGWRYG